VSLGERIKFLLNQKGITQKDLALNIGISQTHAGYIIKGLREPTAGIVKKIAVFLDVSMDWLMGGGRDGQMKIAEPGTAYNVGRLVEKIRSLSKEDQKTIEALIDHLQKRGANGGRRL